MAPGAASGILCDGSAPGGTFAFARLLIYIVLLSFCKRRVKTYGVCLVLAAVAINLLFSNIAVGLDTGEPRFSNLSKVFYGSNIARDY